MEKLTLERVANMYEDRVGKYDLSWTKKDIDEQITIAMGKASGNKIGGVYIPSKVLKCDEDQVLRELNGYVSDVGLKIRRNRTYRTELIIVGLKELRKKVIK